MTVVKEPMASDHVNAAHRVSARIKARLEELGMTNREFAKRVGPHRDAWVSNLLGNKFALSLRELDKAAEILGVPSGELVRGEDDAWELTPTEKHIVRTLRLVPSRVIVDSFAALADHVAGVTPDEVDLLREIRTFDVWELQRLRNYLAGVLQSRGTGHGREDHSDPPRSGQPPAAANPHTLPRRKRR